MSRVASKSKNGFYKERDDRFSSHFLKDVWLSPKGLPLNNPSTLISSSRSSQRIPDPLPIRRQLFCSAREACVSLGYHARGTEMVRPSLKSTCKVILCQRNIFCAGISISIVEVGMPCLSQLVLMVADHALKTSNFILRNPPLLCKRTGSSQNDKSWPADEFPEMAQISKKLPQVPVKKISFFYFISSPGRDDSCCCSNALRPKLGCWRNG